MAQRSLIPYANALSERQFRTKVSRTRISYQRMAKKTLISVAPNIR
jgi:hypothetical protein